MKRGIPVAVFLLLAATVAAAAQSSTGGSSSMTGPVSVQLSSGGSMANEVMGGQGQSMAGFDVRVSASTGSRIISTDDPLAARDGCINYPREAHNSADCSRVFAWDPSWELPKKRLSEMTGAEENMVRSYHILTGRKIDY